MWVKDGEGEEREEEREEEEREEEEREEEEKVWRAEKWNMQCMHYERVSTEHVLQYSCYASAQSASVVGRPSIEPTGEVQNIH